MFLQLFSLFVFTYEVDANVVRAVCGDVQCDDGSEVCGLRMEKEGARLRLFRSECELMNYGCNAGSDEGFGVVSMDYCLETFKTNATKEVSDIQMTEAPCYEDDCTSLDRSEIVCGIEKDGAGYRVRLFQNICKLIKHNCDINTNFTITDFYICSGMELQTNIDTNDIVKDTDSFIDILDDNVLNKDETTKHYEEVNESSTLRLSDTEIEDPTEYPMNNGNYIKHIKPLKNLVVVRIPSVDFERANETIANFFAATHVLDLPKRDVDIKMMNETRKSLIKIIKPVMILQPWHIIPKNISDDHDHFPLLESCYHKCPRTCTDEYKPVCGVPGVQAREPSLVFQNHCYMDVAQCKMKWEDKGKDTAASVYLESSFVFCLGDEMNNVYRFVPFLKTLQRMGRLKKKSRYHYRFRNMKFYNNYVSMKDPKPMG